MPTLIVNDCILFNFDRVLNIVNGVDRMGWRMFTCTVAAAKIAWQKCQGPVPNGRSS
jgi:hypothetical protein